MMEVLQQSSEAGGFAGVSDVVEVECGETAVDAPLTKVVTRARGEQAQCLCGWEWEKNEERCRRITACHGFLTLVLL